MSCPPSSPAPLDSSAHTFARALVERGDHVRAGYRNPKRLDRLGDLEVEPVEGEILDLKAMRKAMRGCETVFHVAGFVAS